MKAGISKIVPWLLAAGLATLSLAVSGHPHPPTKLHVDDADLGNRHHLHTRQAEPASRHVGQEALGAIQEVVGLLMADPGTDWSEVSIARLRRHLADLDEIMLRAEVEERAVDGGVEVVLGGSEQTLAAVRRLVPAHAETMNGFRGWKAAVSDRGGTVHLTLASDDPAEVEVVRALGFFGFMASGVHRPHQLLAVARGRDGH
jgi:hypothetical protein